MLCLNSFEDIRISEIKYIFLFLFYCRIFVLSHIRQPFDTSKRLFPPLGDRVCALGIQYIFTPRVAGNTAANQEK